MELSAYVAELDSWQSHVQAMEDGRPTSDDLPSLPAQWWVRWAGQSLVVETHWLRAGLQPKRTPAETQAARTNLLAHLNTLKQAALALQESGGGSPEEARQRLESILSRKEFSAVHGPTLWDYLRLRLQEWLLTLMDKIFGGLTRYPDAGGILVWAAVAVLLSILALWLRRTWLRSKGVALQLPEPLPPPRDWRDWAREAAGAAARGDYRQAIHSAYWAAIQRLESLGAWPSDDSRTPREYLRLIPPGHEHNPALSALTLRFEAVWYGNRPAKEAEFKEILGHLEALGCQFRWTPATAGS